MSREYHLTPTKDANISIAGVKLKNHRIIGDFPKQKDFTDLEKRFDNPERGDWGAKIVIQVCVFDGNAWREGTLSLGDIDDESLKKLGPESYTNRLFDLKYTYQL